MKKQASILNKGYAVFQKKTVFGVVRYYPENELAHKLVNFKQVAAQQNRKRFIKCLAQREVDAAQETGIVVKIL